MAQEFFRFGDKGINLAHVRSWQVLVEEEMEGDPFHPQVATGRKHKVLVVKFVDGGSERYSYEESEALLALLEPQAKDLYRERKKAFENFDS